MSARLEDANVGQSHDQVPALRRVGGRKGCPYSLRQAAWPELWVVRRRFAHDAQQAAQDVPIGGGGNRVIPRCELLEVERDVVRVVQPDTTPMVPLETEPIPVRGLTNERCRPADPANREIGPLALAKAVDWQRPADDIAGECRPQIEATSREAGNESFDYLFERDPANQSSDLHGEFVVADLMRIKH